MKRETLVDISGLTLEYAGHEDTVGILSVIRERVAEPKSEPRIEGAGGVEPRHGSGLEAQTLVAALVCYRENVFEDRRTDTTAKMGRGGTHGFDFTVGFVELPESAAAHQH